MQRNVTILGSTGSIGTQALEVIQATTDAFTVEAMTCGGSNLKNFAQAVVQVHPKVVGVAASIDVDELRHLLSVSASEDFAMPEIVTGSQANTEIASRPVDVVLNGITGSVGLQPTLAALAAGNTLALANKESLVVGGSLVTRTARQGQIVPVDSEHSALAQCLRGERLGDVSRLILTASGGPFRGYPIEQLAAVTVEQALAHPTWNMGPVVTINSATLVNKGLEIIEAHLLFGVDYQRIEAVVHPQSIIHSMVEFVDGSTMAQISPPDMRLPIAMGLHWPERLAGTISPVDWRRAHSWQFEPLDDAAFPAVRIARDVGIDSGTAPAVFNAANEIAVAAFLSRLITFPAILATVEQVLSAHHQLPADAFGAYVGDRDLTLDAVLESERWARIAAKEAIEHG